jgi:hypothetical protein
MCSSMAIYSKPFCKKVINAPGGISVWATLDFITNDSYAKVKAEWENPEKYSLLKFFVTFWSILTIFLQISVNQKINFVRRYAHFRNLSLKLAFEHFLFFDSKKLKRRKKQNGTSPLNYFSTTKKCWTSNSGTGY